MKNHLLLAMVMLPLTAIPAKANNHTSDPFVTSNLNPFVQLYNLPSARPARFMNRGTLQIRLTSEIANNFTADTTNDESINIDGETWRNHLHVRYSLTDDWEVSIAIPHVAHDGGFLDSFIEDWHKVFGLPNGGRRAVTQNKLKYRWVTDGGPQINIVKATRGLGDTRMQLAYQLKTKPDLSISVMGGVKMPTGDTDDLLGSGSTDVFAGVHVSLQEIFGQTNLSFHGSLSAISLGNSDLVNVSDWLGYGSASLIWHRWERVALKTQVDMHSAVYDSGLKELGDFSAQLSLGGTVALSDRTSLDIAIIEDIATDTSPDVVFHFSLRHRF